jgi:hypothetical protein
VLSFQGKVQAQNIRPGNHLNKAANVTPSSSPSGFRPKRIIVADMCAESADHPGKLCFRYSPEPPHPYTLAAQQAALIVMTSFQPLPWRARSAKANSLRVQASISSNCKFCNRLRIYPVEIATGIPSSPRYLHIHGVISHTPAVVKLHLRAQQSISPRQWEFPSKLRIPLLWLQQASPFWLQQISSYRFRQAVFIRSRPSSGNVPSIAIFSMIPSALHQSSLTQLRDLQWSFAEKAHEDRGVNSPITTITNSTMEIGAGKEISQPNPPADQQHLIPVFLGHRPPELFPGSSVPLQIPVSGQSIR